MRELTDHHVDGKISSGVFALGERGHGGANHQYDIYITPSDPDPDPDPVLEIEFQNGPIVEMGVNGIHNEDLIAIVIDRLRGFQNGPFPCNDNAIALTNLEEALSVLKARTRNRINRGVEGKSES